ncbi:MAG: phage major capsid protein [Spirochaetales bacterium]|nr:phage major capsid protein [Candidatus Physcosoma equi]
MKTMHAILADTATSVYRRNYWNALRNSNKESSLFVTNAMGGIPEMYLPMEDDGFIRSKITEYGTIRSLATCFRAYDGHASLWLYDNNDFTEFVGDGDLLPSSCANKDFRKAPMKDHKAAGITKASTELAGDSSFDFEHYVMKRAARSLSNTEDKAFICGDGNKGPTGLLHAENGAQTSSVVESIGYDDCIDLFFSVKPEYRKDAVWIMNDRTGLSLRKMKDADGNYLWNPSSEKLLGKRVVICNWMPDAEPGKKPVLFGDLSYYWIVDFTPVSISALHELFAMEGQMGYVVREHLDARLVRPEAVKAIEIKSEKDNG